MTPCRVMPRLGCALMALMFSWLLACGSSEDSRGSITLWHSYRGAEQAALESVIATWSAAHPDETVVPLALPYDAFATKLTNAIPRGNGPDLFIAAHERIGDWVKSGLLLPAPLHDPDWPESPFVERTEDALRWNGTRYGLPLAFKSLAIFVNHAVISDADVPKTLDALLRFCETIRTARPGKYCLAYEAGSFYHHAAWLYGFGGGIFTRKNTVLLDRKSNAQSLAFVQSMAERGYIPEEATGALVTRLFNEGRAALAINGPWFLGEIDPAVHYGIHPIPSVGTRPATPFLTVEAVLFPVKSRNPLAAIRFARFLAGPAGATIRATTGKQAVAFASVYDTGGVVLDGSVRIFRELADRSIPMPNDPRMRAVWEPGAQALRQVLRGHTAPEVALERAQRQFDIATRPDPEAASPLVYLAVAFALLVGLFWLAHAIWKRERVGERMRKNFTAYLYIAPAGLGMLLLVFVPFAVGTLVSLYSHRGGEFTFVGLANFWNILSSQDYAIHDPLSFYFTLGVTVMWTVVNVVLHVSVGLFLAMLLRDPWMRLRGLYRVLLIVPWAVPNYITAIIWKGMFHKQFGAINALLSLMGLEPVSWFSSFWTSFAANVATNTWLGFPFMMVVSLGALQAIPRDLEEAAEVDGAGRLTRFWHITLPLLKPALLPAVILGSVWTFNMFNIIYLVSGGEPDGATEILITEAYRWAFTRQEQYGYAAAYATLIFMVLLLYSHATRRLVRET